MTQFQLLKHRHHLTLDRFQREQFPKSPRQYLSRLCCLERANQMGCFHYRQLKQNDRHRHRQNHRSNHYENRLPRHHRRRLM